MLFSPSVLFGVIFLVRLMGCELSSRMFLILGIGVSISLKQITDSSGRLCRLYSVIPLVDGFLRKFQLSLQIYQSILVYRYNRHLLNPHSRTRNCNYIYLIPRVLVNVCINTSSIPGQ